MAADRPGPLVVAIGDIHGRFHRVQDWLRALEDARGRAVDLVLAVGDVEAFSRADDHRRKAARRAMPAEFADYASGARSLHRPLYFLGGNNEDFAALHGLPGGGEIAPGLHYLGRAGVATLAGLRVAFLSGIYAPRYFDRPLLEPAGLETCRQAGYFRRDEVLALESVRDVDVMLTHEWPRGIVARGPVGGRSLRAQQFPWAGNPVTRELVERIRPAWLLCGHSHTAYAATIAHPGDGVTRVACLDQAARAGGAVFWIEWQDGRAARAGWGTSGAVTWEAGEAWDAARTPEDPGVPSATPADPGGRARAFPGRAGRR